MATNSDNKILEPDLALLVDMDQTVVDFVKGWKEVWNEKHPERPIVEDPSDFDLTVAYSGFGNEKEIEEIYHTPDFFLKLDPIEGAIEALEQMSASGIYVSLCSTPTFMNCSWSEKADWIEMHLGKKWVKRLILTKDKTMVHGDYLIDDKPVIEGIYTPTWTHILFDTPYNRDEELKQFRITWKTWPSLLLHRVGHAQ